MRRSSYLIYRVGIILGLLLAFALRLAALDKFGLWDGEVNTVFLAARPLAEFPATFREIPGFTVQSPLWPALIHLLLGIQPALWILRLPAVWAGTATIAAASALARQVLPRRWVLISVWLLAISPLLIRWSQAIRMYAGFMLFSTLSLYFVLRLLKTHSYLAWLAFGLCTLLNLYTHYLAVFPLAAEAGLVVLAVTWSFLVPALARRQAPTLFSGGGFSIPNPWLTIRRTLLAAGVVTLGYLPWFLTATSLSVNTMQERIRVGIEAEEGGGLTLDLPFLHRLFEDVIGGTDWLAWIFVPLSLAGLAYLLARKRYHIVCLILLSLAVPIAMVAVATPPRFHAKYVSYTVPLLVMLVTAGVMAMANWLRWLSANRQRQSTIATGILAGLLALTSAPNLRIDYSYYNGDAEIYEQTTEPHMWHYRAPWPLFIQHIQRSQGAFLFSKALSPDCVAWLCRQIGAQTFISRDASARLLGTDWTKVNEMDAWWVDLVGDKLPEFRTAAGKVVFHEAVSGPNERLWQVHMRVISAQDILPNGSFEEKLVGWQQAASGNLELVREPTASGSLAYMGPNRQAGELSSDPLPVEPGMLLHASMKVYNLTLTYHQTSPRIVLDFESTDHKRVRNSLTTPYSLPYVAGDADSAAGWQQVVTQATVPQNARYVRFSIVTEAIALNRGRPFYVDDVHLMAIRWEPAP